MTLLGLSHQVFLLSLQCMSKEHRKQPCMYSKEIVCRFAFRQIKIKFCYSFQHLMKQANSTWKGVTTTQAKKAYMQPSPYCGSWSIRHECISWSVCKYFLWLYTEREKLKSKWSVLVMLHTKESTSQQDKRYEIPRNRAFYF